MSQDYYVVCDEHRVMVQVGQSGGLSLVTFYSGEPGCMRALQEFLNEHALCDPGPRFLWETAETQEGFYAELEWEREEKR